MPGKGWARKIRYELTSTKGGASIQVVVHRLKRPGNPFLSKRIAQIDFNGAANRFKRQIVGGNAEWLFDFVTQCVQAKKGIGDDRHHEWRHEADRVDQPEREQKAIKRARFFAILLPSAAA